jgi:hypothetical protein
MASHVRPLGWSACSGLGLALGGAIVYVDNFASGGEVSPIVIVAMLFAATAASGAFLSRRAWVVALAASVCVPAAHVVKHLLHLPDTLHPNTYASIAYLAAFTIVVAFTGMAGGMLARGAMIGTAGSKLVN